MHFNRQSKCFQLRLHLGRIADDDQFAIERRTVDGTGHGDGTTFAQGEWFTLLLEVKGDDVVVRLHDTPTWPIGRLLGARGGTTVAAQAHPSQARARRAGGVGPPILASSASTRVRLGASV